MYLFPIIAVYPKDTYGPFLRTHIPLHSTLWFKGNTHSRASIYLAKEKIEL